MAAALNNFNFISIMVLVNWVLTKPVPAPLWVFAPLLLPEVVFLIHKGGY
jgi:hypothetical protein